MLRMMNIKIYEVSNENHYNISFPHALVRNSEPGRRHLLVHKQRVQLNDGGDYDRLCRLSRNIADRVNLWMTYH